MNSLVNLFLLRWDHHTTTTYFASSRLLLRQICNNQMPYKMTVGWFSINLCLYFAHDLPASKIAELSGVSRATINQLFMKLRIRIAQVWNASSALSGEVEADESYFGARRIRGKRGAEQAVKRSSSESWNATEKCRKSSLTPPRWHWVILVICETEACKVQWCSPTNVPFTPQGMWIQI